MSLGSSLRGIRQPVEEAVEVLEVEDDLRAMERMSGVRAERFSNWDEAAEARRREGALLADFDAGFLAPGKKHTLVVTASDVLGSRADLRMPSDPVRISAGETDFRVGDAVVHLEHGMAVLEGLAAQGFSNVILINGHGGPQTAVLNDVAGQLGVSPERLSNAFKTAMKNRIDSTDSLAKIGVPTLVIVGDPQPTTQATVGEVVSRCLRDWDAEQIVAQTQALGHALAETERTYDATLHALSNALDGAAVREAEAVVADAAAAATPGP